MMMCGEEEQPEDARIGIFEAAAEEGRYTVSRPKDWKRGLRFSRMQAIWVLGG